jgi:serine/threonine-protein phosphatase 2A regulatory subunit A
MCNAGLYQVLIAITEVLGAKDCKVHILETLKSLAGDKSWRVRYMIADKYVELAKAVGPEIVKDELIMSFVGLLKDNEAEVRTAGGSQLPGMMTCF